MSKLTNNKTESDNFHWYMVKTKYYVYCTYFVQGKSMDQACARVANGQVNEEPYQEDSYGQEILEGVKRVDPADSEYQQYELNLR